MVVMRSHLMLAIPVARKSFPSLSPLSLSLSLSLSIYLSYFLQYLSLTISHTHYYLSRLSFLFCSSFCRNSWLLNLGFLLLICKGWTTSLCSTWTVTPRREAMGMSIMPMFECLSVSMNVCIYIYVYVPV